MRQQRLLQFGRREQEPPVEFSSLPQAGRHQAFIGVFLSQVEDNRNGLREDQVAIHEHGEFAGRIDLEEFGLPVFAGDHIDDNGLELDA